MSIQAHADEGLGRVRVIALYHFVELPDFETKKQPLLDFCNLEQIKGSILLAKEGINGTVAGSAESTSRLLDFLKGDPRFVALQFKESFCEETPFHRMKVRLKKEIVTLGVAGTDPTAKV